MNKRDEIRRALVSALKGETDAGENVEDTLDTDIAESDLPKICIRSGEESSDLLSHSPRAYKCSLPIEVQFFTSGTTDGSTVQSLVDAMASKIEDILDGNRLDSLLEDLEITGTEPHHDFKGKFFGSAILKLEARYYT